MADIFSIAAMFILFRETLEAAVIISVMLQLCQKLKLHNLKKWVWAGALTGVGLAIVIGIIFICLFYVAQQQVFKGSGRTIFEAFLMLIASALITLLAMMMLKYKGYEQKWQAKLQQASDAQTAKGRTQGWWQIFLMAFANTLREGLESVVFLCGATVGTDPRSIPLAGIVGIILGIIVGVILYYTGKSISDIGWFLVIMSVLLFFIAAGLTARGITYFQFVGWFGYYGYPNSARPWQNKQLWDWSGCCSMDVVKNKFFGLISALFGYTDNGTAIWLIAYFGYWLEVIIVLVARAARGTLLTAGKKRAAKGAPATLPTVKEGVIGPGTPPSPNAKVPAPLNGDAAHTNGNGKLAETELSYAK